MSRRRQKKSRPLTPGALLAADGLFAQKISGFTARAAQQAMADSIAEALAQGESLVCEAGTGTGKTYAYLVPALLSGKKVIVSTGTKPLQDQLFHRDLPTVCRTLGLSPNIALLKGRTNYLCQFRLQQSTQTGELFSSRDAAQHVQQIQTWAAQTESGDIAELSMIPEDAEIWPHITSTTDNCLGQTCPDFKTCHVLKARNQANQADLLVINHAVFFADMALHDAGFGELLPEVEAIILDEAHQLTEIAGNFFGTHFSSRQCSDLCKDSVRAERKEAGDTPAIAELGQALETALKEVHLNLQNLATRGAWQLLDLSHAFVGALQQLQSRLSALEAGLEQIAERGKALGHCYRRSHELGERLRSIVEQPPVAHTRWYERFPRNFVLHLTPLNIASRFQNYRAQRPQAWVFTSATLSVAASFEHFCAELGLEQARTQRWESPFDFRHAALLYVPQDLPEPQAPEYTRAVVEAALPVLQHSAGRAFLLFTSHRALQEAATQLTAKGLPWPLLIQGSMPRAALLARFRELGNAVLLGTGSFWEGVDVRGEALSCVIIDKLPFASPGDPVIEARIQYLRENGGNPFLEYQVPKAVIALKQGVGRLIRDVCDRGVLVICDPRLISKPYGRVFLDSLPPMPKTRFLETVGRFFQRPAGG